MRTPWISDPILWIIALPALVLSGILFQMILSLFSCCAIFKLRGRPILLKWWMIPAAATACGLLWLLAVAYVILG